MKARVLVCTDLDRTLLPNGEQPESPRARPRFIQLAARPEVHLAYVTGRHLALAGEAVAEFGLPHPDYLIADVGTSIYRRVSGEWRVWGDWHAQIAPDWQGLDQPRLAELFSDLEALRLQEKEKQGRFKLSYYADGDLDPGSVLERMRRRLERREIRASLIWSVDETRNQGLLDVLPREATKLHAVQYLMQGQGFGLEQTLFAGDSGNDLPVLASRIHSVLVANATPEVRSQALEQAAGNGTSDALYLARGGFRGMNGNYSAGLLEGLAHYLPETAEWYE
jgi:sucrose-6F-phosphate phosphohydrolase